LKGSIKKKAEKVIPSRKECYELMEKYHMPEHIKEHSMVVEKIASLIGRGLQEAGIELSLARITAGALLHDIAKDLCFNSAEDHAVKGEEICRLNNLDEIAPIVGEHISLKRYAPNKVISEEEIVYYADKRVNHATIVSLEERMEYLFERYVKTNERLRGLIRANFELCKDVEDKLFALLPFNPDEIALLLGTDEIL
jgi:putative nucleotidyltransferase with HDIG domain